MYDHPDLEKTALQHLLESNSCFSLKKTFQEKFNRFEETKLLTWEEDGRSDLSFISMKRSEKNQTHNKLNKIIPLEKKHSTKLLPISSLSKTTKNNNNPQISLPTEFEFISPKSQVESQNLKPLKLPPKEKTDIKQISLIANDKKRFPSPENNFNSNSEAMDKMKKRSTNIKNFKIPLQLKLVAPANRTSLLFSNDFNDNMTKNRQNYSPSNFTILNIENPDLVKNTFPGKRKHLKGKSVENNNFVPNFGNRLTITNLIGVIKNKKNIDNYEREKTYKVLHSLHTMKFFNFS